MRAEAERDARGAADRGRYSSCPRPRPRFGAPLKLMEEFSVAHSLPVANPLPALQPGGSCALAQRHTREKGVYDV